MQKYTKASPDVWMAVRTSSEEPSFTCSRVVLVLVLELVDAISQGASPLEWLRHSWEVGTHGSGRFHLYVNGLDIILTLSGN